MTGVLVRDATVDDAAAIGSIHVRCWRWAYVDLVPGELLDALDESARIEGWTRRLSQPPQPRSATLVSEDEFGEVSGFIHVGAAKADDADELLGELHAVYLDPEAVGTGAGHALISSGTTRMREAGFTRAMLDVLPGNERARAAYEAAGWHAVGEPFTVLHGEHELPHLRYERELG